MTIYDYLTFLDRSPTAWHAAKEIGARLASADYTPLDFHEPWNLQKGSRYFFEREGFVVAFSLPLETPERMIILGSHIDSPALKLKPVGKGPQKNLFTHGVEVYGAPILSSWIGKDLCISGVIHFIDHWGKKSSRLIHIPELPIIIPHLAFHLDRNINDGQKIDRQRHLNPLLSLGAKEKNSLDLIETIIKEQIPMKELLGSDLFLVPLEPARIVGLHQEFIASYRIDNLSSAYASLNAMLEAKPSPHILPISVFWNHEEIGSGTTEGAHSPFMQDLIKILSKVYGIKGVERLKWKENSICISSDAAHAIHPNYPEKHDESAPPELGKGIVIKHNAAKKYATSATTESFIRLVCKKYHIPYQQFVSHSEMPSGSTIGPIFSEVTGIPTVDIGAPQLAMHSSRELMAIEDETHLCNLLKGALEYGEV